MAVVRARVAVMGTDSIFGSQVLSTAPHPASPQGGEERIQGGGGKARIVVRVMLSMGVDRGTESGAGDQLP